MNIWLIPLLSLAGAFAGAFLALWLLRRRPEDSRAGLEPLFERGERTVREEAAAVRRDAAAHAKEQRGELATLLGGFGQQLHAQQEALRGVVSERLDGFAQELRAQNQRLAESQQRFLADARSGREEQAQSLQRFGDSQKQALAALTETQSWQAETLRAAVDAGLLALRTENAQKLEEMRRTVDEKLHDTLEKRLGESFKLVSDRLEQVHKGLGEMQSLATGEGRQVPTTSMPIFSGSIFSAAATMGSAQAAFSAMMATLSLSRPRVFFMMAPTVPSRMKSTLPR